MVKEFIRRDSGRFSKIGKNRKKLQVWRKPKGRDNKMRLKRHGYPKVVSVGFRTNKEERGKLKNKIQKVVYNLNDLEKTNKNDIIIVGKVGAKKKLDIVKRAREMKVEMANVIGPGGKQNATK